MTFWNSIKVYKFLFVLVIVSANVHMLQAQVTNISPYSRFGLGDIHDNSQTEQFSMGGLSIPVIDPFALNIVNPSTYHSLARPMFSVGMRMHLLNINTADETQFNQNHTINNLAVAFPLAKRRWGLTVGIAPFSTIGYNISQTVPVTGLDDDDEVRFEYSGEGGLTRAFIGNAVQLYSKDDTLGNKSSLSVGANVSYIFGSVDRLRKSLYPEGNSAYNVRVRDALRVDDFSIDLGVNYVGYLRKMKEDDKSYTKIVFGANFRVPKSLKTSGSLLAETYTVNSGTNAESPVDTVRYVEYNQSGLRIPLSFGAGVALDMVTRGFQKIMVGVQYQTELWSGFNDNLDSDGRLFDELGDSHKYIAGVDFMPTSKVSRKILSKIHYRLGVRYEQMNLQIDNEQLDAYGISFGLGVPISLKRPQSPSTFNIGVELGQRGTTDNNLVREDYIMISFGLTLMPHFRNSWFVQRKYD